MFLPPNRIVLASFRPSTFVRLCFLAVISLQSGCITVNLIEPSGPVQEVQLSGTGAGKSPVARSVGGH